MSFINEGEKKKKGKKNGKREKKPRKKKKRKKTFQTGGELALGSVVTQSRVQPPAMLDFQRINTLDHRRRMQLVKKGCYSHSSQKKKIEDEPRQKEGNWTNGGGGQSALSRKKRKRSMEAREKTKREEKRKAGEEGTFESPRENDFRRRRRASGWGTNWFATLGVTGNETGLGPGHHAGGERVGKKI